MKPIYYALTGFLVALSIFWLGGIDFNQRGFLPAFAVAESLVLAVGIYFLVKING